MSAQSIRRWCSLTALFLTSAVGTAIRSEPITRVIDLRSLTPEEAAEERHVQLDATVSFTENLGTVFVQDDTGGTFFRPMEPKIAFSIGDRVSITGVTFPGLYLTGIDQAEVEVLQAGGNPPDASNVTADDLLSGRFHYQRVSVEGVVRRMRAIDESSSRLTIATGAKPIHVHIDAPLEDADILVDAEVNLTGLAAGGINDRRQLVQPYVRVARWEDIHETHPAQPTEEIPNLSASSLLQFDPGASVTAPIHRIHLAGQVLASFNSNQVFLRDSSNTESSVAIAVELASSSPAPPVGSQVRVIGFPTMRGFSANLEDALVLEFSPGDAPAPLTIEWPALASGELDSELITLEGTLSDLFRVRNGWQMQLDWNEQHLMAKLPGRVSVDIEPGSLVSATGILRVESTTERGFRAQPDRFELLLRSPNDLQVLRAPPWWTPKRLGILVASLLTVLILGFVWIAILKRQVARQTLLINDRIAREAALEERQRIAREFHDTLEQELAGLSLRLDAATSRPLEGKAQSLLQTSRHLVTRIQTEARNLVTDLRSEKDAPTDLVETLGELIRRQPANGPAINLVDTGAGLELPASIVHHLRMITQEALTNVLKHAEAHSVTIQLRESPTELTLTIHDDGRGIEPDQTQGSPGHFGCMGIRERCRKIKATVSWTSPSDQGTKVQIHLPLPS